MAILKFKTLEFIEKDDFIRVKFLKIFYFDLKKDALKKISDFKINKNSIEFKGINSNLAEKKFNFLLMKGFENLKNQINNHGAVYIHKNSGIPLLGSNDFGIIDRDVDIVEIRPITGCNLECIFCSVSEGTSAKQADFVVEKDYLIEELKKVIKLKECDNIIIHIGAKGEPLLYADIIDLIKDLNKIKQVNEIILTTNGILLNKKLVDDLIKAGLTQFNLSINAIDKNIARKLAGCPYNVTPILQIAEYISKKSKLIITPVWVPGYNDKEMEKLIKFAKKLKCKLGIQNFLNYKYGRNPTKAMPFELFYNKLKKLEKKYNVELIMDHDLIKTKKIPKPFKKGDIVQAEIKFPGRMKHEKIAVAQDRVITVSNCKKDNGKVKLKITRSKYNIFYGVC